MTESPALESNRNSILQSVVEAAMKVTMGLQRLSEQEIGQLMSGLVKSKLLTAEDTFRLRDQMMDPDLFFKAIDRKIDLYVSRQRIARQQKLLELKERLTRLENRAA
jgi:polyhydroxyalkanoate synthesis regulator phasin